MGGGLRVCGWAALWRFEVPPKLRNFFWQACTMKLPTVVALAEKRVQCPRLCHFCATTDETTLHVFVHYDFARSIWRLLGNFVPFAHAKCFPSWVEENFSYLDDDQCCLLMMGCWSLWNARNNRLRNAQRLDLIAMANQLVAFLRN